MFSHQALAQVGSNSLFQILTISGEQIRWLSLTRGRYLELKYRGLLHTLTGQLKLYKWFLDLTRFRNGFYMYSTSKIRCNNMKKPKSKFLRFDRCVLSLILVIGLVDTSFAQPQFDAPYYEFQKKHGDVWAM